MTKKFICIVILFLSIISTGYSQSSVQAKLVSAEMIMDIPPTAASHAATIIELPGKQLLAAWFGGPFESSPEVTIWTARFDQGKWSAPVQVADGIVSTSERYACWNPVLFLTKNNRVMLFYKVGPNPREWWGMMKQSTNGGKSWSAAEQLPESFLGPIKNKPVQLKTGEILHPSSTESADESTWNIHLEKSDSLGRNWEIFEIECNDFGVIQPTILTYPEGRLQMLSRSRQNAIISTWSSDNGESWTRLSPIDVPNPNSGIDAVTLRNGLQVLVYNPAKAGKDWSAGRNKLAVTISVDGYHWREIYTLENNASGEYSYPAVIQTSDGLVHIVYTADRKNIKHVVLRIS